MSILERDKVDDVKKEDFAFKPKLGLVPDFDVPAFLPELAGIADITFNQQVTSIAPSSIIDMPDELPEILVETQPSNSLSSDELKVLKNVETQPIAQPKVVENVPVIPQISNVNENKLVVVEKKEEIPKIAISLPENVEVSDSRSNLLDQIRSFGGDKTKLKNIENRKVANKKKKQEQKEANITLSMTDFKTAINERRKFIADTENELGAPKFKEQSSNNSLLEKIQSVVIPKAPGNKNSDEESDSEWD